jgi:hypothetical protein
LADRLDEALRRERLVLQREAGSIGLDGIGDQRGERGEMIGAVLDRCGPSALVRLDVGGRQQLGQRHDPGQRRADVMNDASKRGFHRAPARRLAWARARFARLLAQPLAGPLLRHLSPDPSVTMP